MEEVDLINLYLKQVINIINTKLKDMYGLELNYLNESC